MAVSKSGPVDDASGPMPAAFRHFLLARMGSSFAYQIVSVALGWQIYALTGNPLDLGLIGLAQFLPMVALTLFVGQAADRFDPDRRGRRAGALRHRDTDERRAGLRGAHAAGLAARPGAAPGHSARHGHVHLGQQGRADTGAGAGRRGLWVGRRLGVLRRGAAVPRGVRGHRDRGRAAPACAPRTRDAGL
jgi:hypothetical protein